MASLSSSAAFPLLSLSLLLFLFSLPVHSATTCPPQKFKNNKIFANCTSLPPLSAALHYTFNATNSSLSVAFVAAAPNPNGWVAWGINPNGTGMAGSQALIALKPSAGAAIAVKTFNLVSYGSIKEEKLSFDVWDLAAESLTGGATAIFASVKLPAGADKVNHIWQVGAAVNNGLPAKHDFSPPNLAAKETLRLTGSAAPAPSPAPGTTPGSAPAASAPGNGTNGGYRIREIQLGSYLGVFAVLAGLIGL